MKSSRPEARDPLADVGFVGGPPPLIFPSRDLAGPLETTVFLLQTIRPFIVRRGARVALCVVGALGLTLLPTRPAFAQGTLEPGSGSLIVPQGHLVAGTSAIHERADALYGPEGPVPVGGHFFAPMVGSAQVPEIAPLEGQLQSLAGASPPALTLGSTVGRVSLEDDLVPLSLRYGITDRITAGATLMVVRRRVDAFLRHTPAGANVGTSPASSDLPSVSAFLAGAGGSLATTSSAVDGYCGGVGEADPQCIGGRALVLSTSTFLTTLGTVYGDESPFPLTGTAMGDAVTAAWGALAEELTEWGAADPGPVPLATGALSDAAFQTLVVAPAWSPFGLPRRTARPFFDVGDVAVHGAVRLVGAAAEARRFLLDLEVTARLATGPGDSLRALAPMGTGRGVSGLQVLLAGEVPAGAAISIDWVGEAGWHGTRDAILLSPDPTRPFSPGHTRTRVSWSPGAWMRFAVAPRLHVGEALSLAGRWEALRQAADTFDPQDAPSPALPMGASRTAHSLGFELRFHGLRPPAAPALRFPFEAFLRVQGSVGGSDGTPVLRSVQGGVAVVLGR